MSASHAQPNTVVAFVARGMPQSEGGALLTLSIEHSITGVGHYTRLMSASSAMSVAELVEAILTAYEWPEQPETWTFRVKCRGAITTYAPGVLGKTSIGTSVGEALTKGCLAQLQVGQYSFLVHATDVVRHEDADDNAVLLGAEFLPGVDDSGRTLEDANALHPMGIPASVSLSEINIALAGEDTVEQVMAHVQPELRELLHDGELYEYVPLLQALDLERPANVSEHAAELLADAPVEDTAVGRAAAWGRIIALSTLVDAESVDEVSESFMQAVGYRRHHAASAGAPQDNRGGVGLHAVDARGVDEACSLAEMLDPEDPLTAAEIRELSHATGRLLAMAGAGGWGSHPNEPVPLVPRCSVVERLEMYRFLLQR